MPKKAPKNAFYFYMLDYKEEQEAQGRKFNGLKEVADAAGLSWPALHPTARAQYERQAKEYKNQPQHVKKYTSKGECVDDVQRRMLDAERAVLRERDNISKLIASGKSENCLTTMTFCLIDVNYYCETKDGFVINEVALMAFTIANGIECIYHTIVDPEMIPAGYAYDAKMSFDTHQLPPPPLDMHAEVPIESEKDYMKILATIVEFLEKYSGPGRQLPYLFTLPVSVAPVKSFLSQICRDYEDSMKFRVYQLPTLFYELKNTLKRSANEGMPTEQLAMVQLGRDTFEYYPGLGCQFHEGTERYYNCCKARVKRWAFIILDHCCQLANVKLVPGDHLPEDVDLKAVAAVKERLDEEHEQRRAKESSLGFQFINYANVSPPPVVPSPPPVVMAAKPLDSRAWPGLGGAGARAPAAALGAWGKPAATASSSAASVVTAARKPIKRSELRKPMSMVMPGAQLPAGIDDQQPWMLAGRGRGYNN